MPQNDYAPQLDSLRAFAVLAVILHHWLPHRWTEQLFLASGVQLFFVLSGFLITGILLDARTRHDREGRNEKGYILRNFYMRRFLRIFPLYYAALFVAVLLNLANARSDFLWHAFYGTNFNVIYRQGWQEEISHFWSLAVEEQFYLFWPFLILFFSRRVFLLLAVTFAVSAPLYRFIGEYFLPQIKLWEFGTPGSFDSLALGALLAAAVRCREDLRQRIFRYNGKLLLAAAGLFIICRYHLSPWNLAFLGNTFLSMVYAIFIYGAWKGMDGLRGAVLDNKILIYLGRISYGLYIIHPFAIIPTNWTIKLFPFIQVIPGEFHLLRIFWTLGLAILSWKLLEEPINRQKKHFPYLRKLNRDGLIRPTVVQPSLVPGEKY